MGKADQPLTANDEHSVKALLFRVGQRCILRQPGNGAYFSKRKSWRFGVNAVDSRATPAEL